MKLRWQTAFVTLITGLALLLAGVKANPIFVFVLASICVVLYARLIGLSTGVLAHRLGPSLGALLGATFGNSVELIIAVFALRQGLYDVVKASVMGSILANLLLTLGVCMVVGGVNRQVQRFSQIKAGLNSVMLFVAVTGLTITSIFSFMHPDNHHIEALSVGVAIVFLLVYVLGFVFSLFTHRTFLAPASQEETAPIPWTAKKAIVTLLIATLAVSVLSDIVVGTVEPLVSALGLTQQFVGLVFLPLIGIAPEFFSAIFMAKRNQMDGSVEIAVGSSLQIALFVAPVLVMVGGFMRRPLTLVFTPIEVVVIFLSTILISLVSLDGETHWFEGIMVVSAYVIFALLFFFQ